MAEFVHVRRISVSLWGRRVGVIVPAPQRGFYAFQYDRAFLNSGIQIAPLMMPLRRESYSFPDLPRTDYYGLPPTFADSLPDSFGSALIDRWLAQCGFSSSEITALDRLAYIGPRAMGALTYEPYRGPGGRPSVLEMRQLVETARQIRNGEFAELEGTEALREIIRLGSSAGGAQAKAVIGWNREEDSFMLGDCNLPNGFEHWIIKFTPVEYPWRGEREFAVNQAAKAAGITTSDCALYELDGLKHFMIRRFDRQGSCRHHLQTLSAIAHFPMSVPLNFRTYEQYLMTVDSLNLGYAAREEAFRRMVFNVYVDECDDHSKNFSFLMDETGEWTLAPAYDLTGSDFPSADPWKAHAGHHQLSVNGKFSNITDADLLMVADRLAIGTASRIIEQVKEAVGRLKR